MKNKLKKCKKTTSLEGDISWQSPIYFYILTPSRLGFLYIEVKMSITKKAIIEYFPHYVNHKKTLFILESKYKNDGYAFWFKLLELLGATENHFLDCNENSTWEFLIAKTLVDEEKAKEILNLLAELKKIDSELWKNKIIWSENFIKNLENLYKRRSVNIYKKEDIKEKCLQKSDPVGEIVTKVPLSGTDCNKSPQSIVEESIVEESKTYTSGSSDAVDYFFSFLDDREKERFEKQRKKYLETADKLLRIDKYKLEEIKQAINFAKKDHFWSNQFQSFVKLRQKDKTGMEYIEVFLLKAKNKDNSTNNSNNNKTETKQITDSKDYKVDMALLKDRQFILKMKVKTNPSPQNIAAKKNIDKRILEYEAQEKIELKNKSKEVGYDM
jgi:hypothetical protein